MESFIKQFGEQSSVVHGIIVSCILLCAAFSSIFAGVLADRLGRRHAMAFGAAVFAVGVTLEAAAVRLSMFAVGRVIEGLGYGLFFSTQTVYICEIAPPKARGALASAPQFMTCVALVTGYFISYGTLNIAGSLSWRLPFIITDMMAIMYLLSNLFLLPESPRWLMQHRNHHAAEKVWDALEVKQEDREVGDGVLTSADDPMRTMAQSNPPREERQNHVNFRRLWSRDVRKQTFLAVFLLGFLQLCGIDAVLYVRCSISFTTFSRGFFDFFFLTFVM
jgi:MFS family permease